MNATASPSVLIVDDETGILETLKILLKNEGFTPYVALGGKQGLEQIAALTPDIVLSDVRMPNVGGLEILSAARAKDPFVPVILMTAQADLRSAIQAVNEGAYHYIQKPFVNDEIITILRRAAEHRQLRVENQTLRQEIKRQGQNGVSAPIGRSKAWLTVLRLAETVAPTDSIVLIQGESGTGKEVVARYIHELSQRTEGTFNSINCGALPESLLESELFGHMKGSFTGAISDRAGKFEQANKGTLFLDEIGDMSLAAQAKVLRVLQDNVITRIGGAKPISVDVRVIAATNKTLENEIAAGKFREDLYYRLNVVPIHVPPIRERREDIPTLAQYFTATLSAREGIPPRTFTQDALERLSSLDWPGNVRELRNTVERLLILAPDSQISARDIDRLAGQRALDDAGLATLTQCRTFEEFKDAAERAFLLNKLREFDWNVSETARAVEMPRSNLYKKIERYSLSREHS